MPTLRRIAASPWLIFSAAFITRLAGAIYIVSRYTGPQLLFLGNEPSHIAAALVSGEGFSAPYANVPVAPTAQQPPLYPFILAGIFKLFGAYTVESAWVAVLINVLAGSLTAVLLYYAGKLHFGETVGIVAAWLWVLPWMYRIDIFTVSLTNAYLSALGLTALLMWVPEMLSSNSRWLLLGIYCGILCLLQPALLPVTLVYGSWLALSQTRSPRVLIGLAGLVLTLAPWTIRNYLTFGRLIPLRDNLGLELWLGNHPGMRGTVDFSSYFSTDDYARLGELRFMDASLNQALQFIMRDPAAFAARVFRRAIEFWYVPYPIPWVLLRIMGWLGAVLAMLRSKNQWCWLVMLFVFPLVYYVTHNFPTYRHPIEPLVILLAAYCMVEALSSKSRRAEPSSVVSPVGH